MNGKSKFFCLGEIKIGSSYGFLLDNVVNKGSQLKGQSRRTYMRGLLEAGEALSLMGLDLAAKSIFEQNLDFFLENPSAAKKVMQQQLVYLINARHGGVTASPPAAEYAPVNIPHNVIPSASPPNVRRSVPDSPQAPVIETESPRVPELGLEERKQPTTQNINRSGGKAKVSGLMKLS